MVESFANIILPSVDGTSTYQELYSDGSGRGSIIAQSELLRRLAAGDEAAFQEIYDTYWRKLYGAAFKRLPDHSVVKDILQNIFVHIWEKRSSLVISNFDAYLFSAVRNRVLKHLSKAQKITPLDTVLTEIEAFAPQGSDLLILRDDLRKAYFSLIDTLTPSQRQIVRMRFEDDLTTEDIAERMEISRKTVQNQLRTALVHIRSSMVTTLILFILKSKV